jgi:hypothetical protein
VGDAVVFLKEGYEEHNNMFTFSSRVPEDLAEALAFAEAGVVRAVRHEHPRNGDMTPGGFDGHITGCEASLPLPLPPGFPPGDT